MDDEQVESALKRVLEDVGLDGYQIDEGYVFEGVSASTFDEQGLMTKQRGVVLSFPDGSEFQLTILQSKRASR